MPYKRVEIELSEPLGPIALSEQENGIGLVARWHGELIGFAMIPFATGSTCPEEKLSTLADERFAQRVLALKAANSLALRWPETCPLPLPSLSIVICTRDRAHRLARLLESLVAVRQDAPFPNVQIVVVDNAPSDDSTRDVARAVPGIDYVCEPKAGLNFARNAALRAARGSLIAYLDDDVVVDRNWLQGLAKAWRSSPSAGGYTGLVLPYRLDTEAQIRFERRGGFGRGFERRVFHAARYEDATHPASAGNLGAGCNMAFDRALLRDLGGFDEALDTGAPLPGGGDLDIFYRVLRSGRIMVYEPAYAVYHEHRETIAQLRRQYWTWGLGFMAYITKCQQSDPDLTERHRAIRSWWIRDRIDALLRALRKLSLSETRFVAAELRGGVIGMAGEYRRSRKRIAAIRERAA
jgi:glycosyltransferase involved in cell wall biosynthesis